MAKTYVEPQTTLDVYDECDILVVGGGAAGHSAAIAAARAGCKNIILMERYGYCGGDVTGGYVLLIPDLSFHSKTYVKGIQEEWFTRLKNIPGAVRGPEMKLAGSRDPLLMKYWGDAGGATRIEPKRINHAFMVEPTQLKIEMDKMLAEYSDSIRIMYHSWGCKPIMDNGVCKGVIFESKEGRKAVMAKIVIDATGDADICRGAGAPVSSAIDDECRCGSTALVFRVGGISRQAWGAWRGAHPQEAAGLMGGIADILGFRCAPIAGPDDDKLWFNNWQPKRDCSKIKDQTATELAIRLNVRDVVEYLQTACPEIFGKAFLYDIAPQLGTRGSYRIVGQKIIEKNDWIMPKQYDDTIAWHCTVNTINDNSPIEIPYGSILPQKVENILAPGRHISADPVAIDNVNLIPQCVGTGQAAGVAAAVAVAKGQTASTVDIKAVQDILAGEQDVPLPRNEHTDKSYTDNVVEHEYGLYTSAAKEAIAAGDANVYRHWTMSAGSGKMKETNGEVAQ